jgi:hypothetical protein
MSKLKLILLTGFAVMAVVAMAASSASAAIKYEWSVNGTALAANQTVLVTVLVDPTAPTVTFKAKLSGATSELKSSTFKSDNESWIAGGKPGTGAGAGNVGKTLFEKITVVKPANCTVANVVVESTAEIVESETGEKALILFKPNSTTGVFAEITYAGGSCTLNGVTVKVAGSVAAEPTAVGTGVQLLWKFLPNGTKTRNSNSEVKENNLIVFGTEEKVELAGSVLAELSTLQVWTAL